MEQAALLAAEAAMQEAAKHDANSGGRSMGEDDGAVEMDDTGDGYAMDAEQMALMRAIQEAEMGDHANVLQDMNMMADAPENVQALLHMLQPQQQQEIARPDEHYLTVSQNEGVILESTQTVTGFAPNDLLMTSAYDAVYEDDLPGLLAVKSHFWDKGRPDAEAYLRRRTIDGDWIWLATKAVSYVEHQQIPQIILMERAVEDTEHVRTVSRITRITSILVQAVEAAQIASLNQLEDTVVGGPLKNDVNHNDANMNSASGGDNSQAIPWIADDAAAYQAMLGNSNQGGTDAQADDPLFQLIKAAAAGGAISKGQAASNFEREIMERVAGKKRESFDPFSVLEDVREGVRLDFGTIHLSVSEVRLVNMVLTGRLLVEDTCELVFQALNTGFGLNAALDHYMANNPRLPNGVTGHPQAFPPGKAPPISVLNLSYTYIGNTSIDLLCEVIAMHGSPLRTLDISFCGLMERGSLSLARAFRKRKRKGIMPLRGILLSGNHITYRAATDIGRSLSPDQDQAPLRSKRGSMRTGGYEEDSETEDDEDYGDIDLFGVQATTDERKSGDAAVFERYSSKLYGLQVLHLGATLESAEAVAQFLHGLGPSCPVKELSLASNNIRSAGIDLIVGFLEGTGMPKKQTVMPFLNRLDLSNNRLGNEGLTKLTRAVSRRSATHFVELRLTNNGIAHGGIETMMNKLLQHNLVSLSLDKNAIGDQGCQLVAASLQSLKHLARLNLGFNQIGSRGVNSLMRSLVACESMTYLSLSGNIMKISGAVALAFALAQHPRIEELDVDNCCLSQAAQCHIIAGIISNRWVPMKRMNGFEAGPPMMALGALTTAQTLTNEECFRIRKDEQMKTILQWMESNRLAKMAGRGSASMQRSDAYLTPDFVQSMNEVQGTPSQNAYLRLLGWLRHIPFDEDELISLRKYFYDSDGANEDRGSDGYVNLKLRGDLLAALESDVADELRDETPMLVQYVGSVGVDLRRWGEGSVLGSPWEYMKGDRLERGQRILARDPEQEPILEEIPGTYTSNGESSDDDMRSERKRPMSVSEFSDRVSEQNRSVDPSMNIPASARSSMSTMSRTSQRSMQNSGSERSYMSQEGGERRRGGGLKARITMFPQFEMKLEELKATATEMIDEEEDQEQQEVILTQYAEASLTILRQLRYHCMNSGLDGWRQGSMKRKVLIVDDSLVTRKMVSRAFEKGGFIVDTASNGAEGVDKLKLAIYDIAFMDIDMPVMNGFEATKRLREWEDAVRPGTRQPICALTAAYVDDFERSELMKFKEAGLDVMESKPCNIPRLFKVVDDVSPMFSDLSISVIQQERGIMQNPP